ncbi:MAG: hypothetical protein OXQ31_07765, partial [Spirochaetaceae bacterium]|nr:hypothetical protein [Spirochaetaceae bacterium]
MLLSSGQPGEYIVHHEPELTAAARERAVGRARLRCPPPVTAGTPITAEFEITVGEHGLPAGGRIAIAWRWPLDFGDLQMTEPRAPDYLSTRVVTPGPDVRVEARYHGVSRFNPWNHAVEVTVCGGSLPSHGTVLVTCSRWQAPTCSTMAARFLVVAQDEAGADWRQMVDPAPIAVRPGAPAMLGVVVAGFVGVGRGGGAGGGGTPPEGHPAPRPAPPP